MIGVITDAAGAEVAAEFFELFKTNWEIYREGSVYDVVLDATGQGRDLKARLVVRYGGGRIEADEDRPVESQAPEENGRLVAGADPFPLYGSYAVFESAGGGEGEAAPLPRDERGGIGYVVRKGGSTEVRLGYDLFSEIRTLLSAGQPAEWAAIPTLELHIDLLRGWMAASGVEFNEVRPAPAGYRFVAALTHDVDHPSLRLHGLDHTVAGFLGRASVGSVRRWVSGRLNFLQMVRNWGAVLRWPAVAVGWGRDFWRDFVSYPNLENGKPSTFFVIPFAGQPGSRGGAAAPSYRASGYGAADIEMELRKLREGGCEVGLHGLDAWCDVTAGERERTEVERAAAAKVNGVRMHWLYFGPDSTALLDEAGFDYDSTVGYNGTIGFRAGTAQVYRPLGVRRLLELPLIVMDTALFYPSHLNLTEAEAWERVEAVVAQSVRFGGCVTVNWHDRSLSPERQWGKFYWELVQYLEAQGGWVTSAGEAVEWFRRRRDNDKSDVKS